MRPALISLFLAAMAFPAAAQVTSLELDTLRAQQEAAHRRAIDLDNQFQAQDAQRRADQAASMTEPRPGALRLRTPPALTSALPGAETATPIYPSIPDAALAESNRRIREAARNRR